MSCCRLYSYRARWYLPEAGVFAERDPVGYSEIQGLYLALGANTPGRLDPFGRYTQMWSGTCATGLCGGFPAAENPQGLVPKKPCGSGEHRCQALGSWEVLGQSLGCHPRLTSSCRAGSERADAYDGFDRKLSEYNMDQGMTPVPRPRLMSWRGLGGTYDG